MGGTATVAVAWGVGVREGVAVGKRRGDGVAVAVEGRQAVGEAEGTAVVAAGDGAGV